MFEILSRFSTDGTPVTFERYGNGHINETYLVLTDREHPYILQKINNTVFRDVEGLMENISRVTKHLFDKVHDPRRVLTLVPTVDNKTYVVFQKGYYRLYEYVTDSICLDAPENEQDFYESADAFGHFQQQLSDFPAHLLHETIPHFHDTPDRYRQFKEAMDRDPLQRKNKVREEIDFVLSKEKDAAFLIDMQRNGDLPIRVTHNDTKLNNVLLDRKTRKPLCVIDLDTVMPGLAANDFGDSIRFGASTAKEDETCLEKVTLDLNLYKIFTNGFLNACGSALTQNEIETLPYGAQLMTLECGVRFLADYLNGDIYFHTTHETHNLERARTQFKLVREMEKNWDTMMKIVKDGSGQRR